MLNENLIKGQIIELKVQEELLRYGFDISIPTYNASRYDLIADIDGKLIRVQCKTSREVEQGVIEFPCRSCRSNTQSNLQRRYSADEVDYFATFWDGKCYLVPISECSVAKKLRFIPPKNGQKVGISYAKDYEIQGQLEKLKG